MGPKMKAYKKERDALQVLPGGSMGPKKKAEISKFTTAKATCKSRQCFQTKHAYTWACVRSQEAITQLISVLFELL